MPARSYEIVLAEIVAIVRQRVEDVEVTEESRFVTDLRFDSIGIMNLVAEIEDHFDVTISLNVLPELQTVADTARHVVALIAEATERIET